MDCSNDVVLFSYDVVVVRMRLEIIDLSFDIMKCSVGFVVIF